MRIIFKNISALIFLLKQNKNIKVRIIEMALCQSLLKAKSWLFVSFPKLYQKLDPSYIVQALVTV